MKAQYLVPIVAIMLVLSVSGCVNFGGFSSWFGPTQPTVEQTPDILVTSNQRIIPTPPILADSEFTVMFTLRNQDQTQDLKNVGVKLYDWGTCTPVEEDSVPKFLPTGWEKDTGFYSINFENFFAAEEKVIEFNFMAPNNQRIGNIGTDCPIKWEINYYLSARSQDDFTVISKDRKRELDVAGSSWTGTNQAQYVGIGPIKMYFDFKTPMPVQSKSSIQFGVTVVDKGVGTYTKIADHSMYIKIPEEWMTNTADPAVACTTGFVPVMSGTNYKVEEGYALYTNSEPINMYQRETSEIICRFTAPDLDEANIPEKTYYVSANVTDYNYKLVGSMTANIKPSV